MLADGRRFSSGTDTAVSFGYTGISVAFGAFLFEKYESDIEDVSPFLSLVWFSSTTVIVLLEAGITSEFLSILMKLWLFLPISQLPSILTKLDVKPASTELMLTITAVVSNFCLGYVWNVDWKIGSRFFLMLALIGLFLLIFVSNSSTSFRTSKHQVKAAFIVATILLLASYLLVAMKHYETKPTTIVCETNGIMDKSLGIAFEKFMVETVAEIEKIAAVDFEVEYKNKVFERKIAVCNLPLAATPVNDATRCENLHHLVRQVQQCQQYLRSSESD